jgi:RNA polymerase sigma-70 factor (ECF subfamily)
MNLDKPSSLQQARSDFDQLVIKLRPKLHRYCARMTGSAVDGEDVVQEALAKAFFALSAEAGIENLEAWMFRIAHNAALDFLRRRQREREVLEAEESEVDTPEDEHARADSAKLALTTFMHLVPRQRSCVILKDVLGYSIREIGNLIDATDMAVKAALHRGREHLSELGERINEDLPFVMDTAARARLSDYIARFNARDFDALRNLLAEDVRLDLVGRHAASGKVEVGNYFGNYDRVSDWRLSLGYVDGRPAILVADPRAQSAAPPYFVLVEWVGKEICAIRDFRYARYVADEAVIAEE